MSATIENAFAEKSQDNSSFSPTIGGGGLLLFLVNGSSSDSRFFFDCSDDIKLYFFSLTCVQVKLKDHTAVVLSMNGL